MTTWRRLEDGMPDPQVGGPELSAARQQAIDDALKLMGCDDKRGSDCEHAEALAKVADLFFQTAASVLGEGIRALPRPLDMRDIDSLLVGFAAVALLASEESEESR